MKVINKKSITQYIKGLLLLTVLMLGHISVAQTRDSLLNAYKKATHDTSRINTLLSYGEQVYMQDPDSAERIWKTCFKLSNENQKLNSKDPLLNKAYRRLSTYSVLNLAAIQTLKGDIASATNSYKNCIKDFTELGDNYGLGNSFLNYGQLLINTGAIDSSTYFTEKGLVLFKKINKKELIGTALNNLGLLYDYKGEIDKSLKYYFEALGILEKINNYKGMSYVSHNIGAIYDGQKDFKKALEYYQKGLDLRTKIEDQFGIAESYLSIGSVLRRTDHEEEALVYYFKALKIQQQMGDINGLAVTYNNLGSVYKSRGDLKNASDYLLKSMEIQKKIDDKNGLSYVYCNLSVVFEGLKNYQKSFEFAKQSLKYSEAIGYPENIKMSSLQLYLISSKMGNHKTALESHLLFIKMRDSLNNIETQKSAIRLQADFDYKQKKAIADAENKATLKQQEEKADIERNKQYVVILCVSFVLLSVVVFSFFVYKRFRITQQQKITIELKERETNEQKLIIEEKHREITDSINYAERIQRSCLATEELLNKNLRDYFIFYKPKSIVSGDFYWGSVLSNGNFAFALADSTGHGVPGAIMSLLNIASLEKAISLHSDPGKILDSTRDIIIEKLKNDGSNDGGKDGMDCSLLVIDKKKNKMHVASANNPVWIFRNNAIIEIKGDKMPVGKSDRQDRKFVSHTVDLNENDIIYTLTDGYADQFGGIKGKKFMLRNLKELIISNAHLPLMQQKKILENNFTEWIDKLEQIDDVSVFAIKI